MSFSPKRNLRRPKPPGRLSREAKAWWKRILDAFPLEDASLLILESGLECFDTMRQAQETIRKSGTVVDDRFGCPKMHPAVLIERDAKSAMLRHFKALSIDLEPLRDAPGRPPGT